MYVPVLHLSKNKHNKALSREEWEDISIRFSNYDNSFFELDYELKRVYLCDFYKMLEILHGEIVKNDDNSFSLFPRLIQKKINNQLRIMENIIQWFKKYAITLYDAEDCMESIIRSVVLGRNDQNLVYIYYKQEMISLREFLEREINEEAAIGEHHSKYYIVDVRGYLK